MKKLMVLMVMLAMMVGHEAVAHELTDKEKGVIMKAVKRELKDPESARFQWVKLADKINPKHFVATYCGLVNAKNGYGGYIGYEPFQVQIARQSNGFEVISVTLSNAELSSHAVFEMCVDDGYEGLLTAK